MWSNRWIKGQDYPEWAEDDTYIMGKLLKKRMKEWQMQLQSA